MVTEGTTALYTLASGTHKAYIKGGYWRYTYKGVERACAKLNKLTNINKPTMMLISHTHVDTDTDNKCSVCLENVRFPMSNGCCSYKFCKSCFDQMPQTHKAKCGGCRQNTVFSTIRPTQPIMQNPLVQRQRQELLESQELITELRQSYDAAVEARDMYDERYQEAEHHWHFYEERQQVQEEAYEELLTEERERKSREIADLNETIKNDRIRLLKNNELHKFNTNLSYIAIGVVILQYFL